MKNALFFILGAVSLIASVSLAQIVIKPIDQLTQEENLQIKTEEYGSKLSSLFTTEDNLKLQEEYKNNQQVISILKEQNAWLIRIYEKISR